MRFFLLLSLFAFLYISCGNENDACFDDPDCEYFRCKVNGEEWSTNCERDPLFACSAIDVLYGKSLNALDFKAINQSNNQTITFFLRNSNIKLGKNKLFKDDFLISRFSDGKKVTDCILYPIDTLKENFVELFLIDTINFKLEGKVEMNCLNNCNESIKIEDAVFKVKYRF